MTQRRKRRTTARRNPYRTANKAGWFRAYKARMQAGEESCRNCGTRCGLTFGHIEPVARGGRPIFANTTIMCQSCNLKQGMELWSWQVSLAEEEKQAPAAHRWSQVHPAAMLATQRKREKFTRRLAERYDRND